MTVVQLLEVGIGTKVDCSSRDTPDQAESQSLEQNLWSLCTNNLPTMEPGRERVGKLSIKGKASGINGLNHYMPKIVS